MPHPQLASQGLQLLLLLVCQAILLFLRVQHRADGQGQMETVAEEVLELLEFAPLGLQTLQHLLFMSVMAILAQNESQVAELRILEHWGHSVHQNRDLNGSNCSNWQRDFCFVEEGDELSLEVVRTEA